MTCPKCKGRGWYQCEMTHSVWGIEVHEDGKKECGKCQGTGQVVESDTPKEQP